MAKKLLYGLLTILLIFVSNSPEEARAESVNEDQEKIMITFEEEIDYELLDEMGAEIHTELSTISTVIATLPESQTVRAAGESSIAYIEEDQVVEAAAQAPSWGYNHIKAPAAKAAGYTGKGIKIAVVDSGINRTHPDLKIAGGISIIENSSPYTDPTGHGTHVAGIIGALDNTIGVVGVAPGADIYSVKVLSSTGLGTLIDVVEGIDWAIKNDMDIINLSLTTQSNSETLRNLLNEANKKGFTFVAAAGNNETNATITDVLYPAKYPSVIAVGSVSKNNTRSYFSYYGPSLEIMAPGEGINSTAVNAKTETQNDYGISNGTSVATPFVTGVIAQYMEAYPHLSHSQIRGIMRNSAIDLGPTGRDNQFGYGLVQPIQSKAALFPDLKNNVWYTESITGIFNEGVVTGFPDGTYRPDANITRAEAITMIGRVLELTESKQENFFKDVSKDSYALGYINAAYKLGYVKGITDGVYGPEVNIKRGDMALILQRAFGLESTGEKAFTDVSSNEYYYDAIQAAYDNNIIQGRPDGLFYPQNPINRAEFAEMLNKAIKE
ncbi:S8 family peptidase [Jeotgalibacillus proteolyticus]|uniref:Alkaline serine protease n=1 Tax=Jeotgalibacillus proteolyticus TaxID=2082395 RepID=A0A2S5GBZ5_9BACL|nr:S8 family serine peptidase [Jeotgalibacillus proteolyticus]PPA70516.1 alkaline serine protease [Jeotgalibacillus proteolyticus]